MKPETTILTEKGLDPRLVKFISEVADFGINKIKVEGYLPIHAVMLSKTDDEKDSIMVMNTEGYGSQDKDMVMECVRFFAYDVNADAVAIVAESWATPEAVSPEKIERDMKIFGSVSMLPYREEIIMVSLNYKVGSAMITYQMQRDKSGNLTGITLRNASVSTDHTREFGRLTQTIYTDEDMNHPMFNLRISKMRELLSGVPFRENEDPQNPSKNIR